MATHSGSKKTPMMIQWEELKSQAGDFLLFFRLGDFYELFEKDAEIAAPAMGVTLTSRNSKSDDATPLCGVPVANFELYLSKLLDQGFAVALAEQVEEARPGQKGLVRREIVQFFTPGIRFLSSDQRPHYVALAAKKDQGWVCAAADVATGHVVFEKSDRPEGLQELVDRLPIEDLRSPFGSRLPANCPFERSAHLSSFSEAKDHLFEGLGVSDLKDTPTQSELEIQVMGSLFRLIQDAHPGRKLRYLKPLSEGHSIWVSAPTRKNLNLFEPADNSLFSKLDETKTAMGRRQLKHWLSHPVGDAQTLAHRQGRVQFFKAGSAMRLSFRKHLQGVRDVHRILRHPRSAKLLLQLERTLSNGLLAAETLENFPGEIESFQSCSIELEALRNLLSQSLQWSDQADRGWIQEGVSPQLDELRRLESQAGKLLSDLELSLRSKFKIPSLKIKFHQVFGYVAEVTATQRSKLPAELPITQSLASSVRFKTDAIQELEQKILSLRTRMKEAESSELEKLFARLEDHRSALLDWADHLSQLDAYQALAEVSQREGWSQPITLDRHSPARLKLEEARHPLVLENFVPLSFSLVESERVMLLTGPNMAGKSTVLRLAALCALLHQIGSDVPARRAELSLFDRILCRMGAQDDTLQGRSTFFVEMLEVASMLQGSTDRSLLLFDEIGRGTSTFDGMSLAWAITEHVHELGCLSAIATHYLELSKLESSLSGLRNYHLGVEEVGKSLVFTRKLKAGPASQSYGIQVARLAQIDERILDRAEQKLREFEKKRTRSTPLFEMQLP